MATGCFRPVPNGSRVVRPLPSRRPGQPLQAAIDVEERRGGVILGQPMVLGQVADRAARRRSAGGTAEQRGLARRGRDHAEKNLDQRRLARAVLAEEAEDLATVHLKAHLVERLHPPVPLPEAVHRHDIRRRHRHAAGSRIPSTSPSPSSPGSIAAAPSYPAEP